MRSIFFRETECGPYLFFFFQAEDGIRAHCVTGVQTCALPICSLLGDFRRDRLLRRVRKEDAGEHPQAPRSISRSLLLLHLPEGPLLKRRWLLAQPPPSR